MKEKLLPLKATKKNDLRTLHGAGALTVAPAILQAKDQGRQFIVAVSDPAFPFAADAELVIPCERDRSGAGVGTLSPAQGGLDNPRTAAWLLKNWEGSAKVFDRRKQLYEGVLGQMGAAEGRGEQQTIHQREAIQKQPTTPAKTRPRPGRS